MPNSSILPLTISFGLFVAAFGALYHQDPDKSWTTTCYHHWLLITFGSMFIRSIKDDHGYHIHKEELLDDLMIRGLRHNGNQ